MNEATGWVLGSFAAALLVVGTVFGVAWSIHNTSQETTRQVQECAQAGGTWISASNATYCVGQGAEVR